MILLCWTGIVSGRPADRDFQVALADGTEISVEVMSSPGSLLVIWFVDHDEDRRQFEGMLKAIHAHGLEVWRVDLLADFFLPRTSENVRTLPGEGVAAIIEAAHTQSDKTILLATYDRMPLPLLRGVRAWSADFQGKSRLAGSILYYPNLFGPAPVAGEAPSLDPVVAASNYPLVIVQPGTGSQRWRLDQVMEALWSAGAPAYVRLLDDVRDWFFMHPPDTDPQETLATRAVPVEMVRFASLLQSAPKPEALAGSLTQPPAQRSPRGLVPFDKKSAAPALNLAELGGDKLHPDYQGKITLINFWATWCPPCVEELPSLNRLKRRFSGEPFNLISVDFRESKAELREFTAKVPVEFPILLDLDGRSSLEWGVFSFPSSFLIDHHGRIRYSINRAIDWETQEVLTIIETLLAEMR